MSRLFFKIVNYSVVSIAMAIGLATFFGSIATLESVSEMWAIGCALVCGALMAVFLFIKPLEAILVYFSLYPTLILFNNVEFPIRGSSATISFGGMTLSVLLLCGSVATIMKKGAADRECRWIKVLFAAFLTWLLVGIVVNFRSLDIIKAVKELGRITGVFIVFLIGLKYTESERDLRRFLYALLLSLAIPSSVGVFQIIEGTRYLELEHYNRIMGTFGIPNMFGMYLVLPLLILMSLSLARWVSGGWLIASWPLFYLLLLLLFFTYTRASWLAFMLGVLVVGVKKYKRLIPYSILGILILVTALSLQALRITTAGSSGRIAIWTSLAPAVLSEPFFGHGLTSIGTVSMSLLGFRNSGQNQYLLYGIEGGLPAVSLFILLLMALYRNSKRCYMALPDGLGRATALGYIGFLLGVCVIAFFESNAIFQFWVWLPAGVILGLTHNPREGNQRSTDTFLKSEPPA